MRVQSTLNESVIEYFEEQKHLKETQSQFNELKAQFYEDMENYFSHNETNGKFSVGYGYDGGELVVTRIQNSKVEFDADKLERALGKGLASDVIQRHYEVINMKGLIAYLKSCGVDPNVFKSFLNITKSVDTKALDKLEELGKVSAKQVKGCYTVKKQNPYFTVSIAKEPTVT